jgi:hypothetical protein
MIAKRDMLTAIQLAHDVLNQWNGDIDGAIKDIEGTIKSFSYTIPIHGAREYYAETLERLKEMKG